MTLRTRTKIIIIAAAVIIILLAVGAMFFTGLIVIPRSTQLNVTPSEFELESGKSITLIATLTSDSFILSGKELKWSVTDGSLDKAIGEMVVYTAPVVSEIKQVTITVSFAGDKDYWGCSTKVTATILPAGVSKTSIVISPSSFEVESGKSITLTATLEPPSAPSEQIEWVLEGPGTISPVKGPSVTYTAPEVTAKTTIKITAKFLGTSGYLSSTSEPCYGTILPKGTIAKKATILSISPTSASIVSGESKELTATLKDVDGNVLTGKTIKWSLEGPGTLSATTGTVVTYKAPEVLTTKTAVKVTATFEGDESYSMSSATVIIEVAPAPVTIAGLEYEIKFNSAMLKNVIIEGPVAVPTIKGGEVNGVRIVAEKMEISDFALSRIGLSSSMVEVNDLEIYAVRISAYSPSLGKTLEITSESATSLGPYDTLSLENGVILLFKWTAKNARFMENEVSGEYIGGKEPYVPTIINAPKADLLQGYAIEDYGTYKELKEAVLHFTVGRGEVYDLVLAHPMQYSLDRFINKFTSDDKWIARASKAVMTSVDSYMIYLTFKAYGMGPFTITGEDPMGELMEHAARGVGGTINDGSMHLIYATIDEIFVENFALEIRDITIK